MGERDKDIVTRKSKSVYHTLNVTFQVLDSHLQESGKFCINRCLGTVDSRPFNHQKGAISIPQDHSPAPKYPTSTPTIIYPILPKAT
jgi:hypothetical protein